MLLLRLREQVFKIVIYYTLVKNKKFLSNKCNYKRNKTKVSKVNAYSLNF